LAAISDRAGGFGRHTLYLPVKLLAVCFIFGAGQPRWVKAKSAGTAIEVP